MNDNLERFDPLAWLEENVLFKLRPPQRPTRRRGESAHREERWSFVEVLASAAVALGCTTIVAGGAAAYADPIACEVVPVRAEVPPEIAHDMVPDGYWARLRTAVDALPAFPDQVDDGDEVPDLLG